MLHPIWWSWYAVIMLLFNLAKGAALAASRILYMLFLNFCQFAIIDKTSFPTGYESMDPGYSSFLSLVYFTSKYRNPLITTLIMRHVEQSVNHEEKSDDEPASKDQDPATLRAVWRWKSRRIFVSWLQDPSCQPRESVSAVASDPPPPTSVSLRERGRAPSYELAASFTPPLTYITGASDFNPLPQRGAAAEPNSQASSIVMYPQIGIA
jgi:hypothetical protein